MNANIRLLLLTGLLVACPAWAGADVCCVKISVDVESITNTDGSPALNVRLTNRDNHPIKFMLGLGPWAGPASIDLVAVRLPGAAPILHIRQAIADPAPGDIELAVGQSEEHALPLTSVYPEIVKGVRTGSHEILLFWTYQLRTRDGKRSERQVGWLSFPEAKTHGDAHK